MMYVDPAVFLYWPLFLHALLLSSLRGYTWQTHATLR